LPVGFLLAPGFFRFSLAMAVFFHHISRVAIGHAAVCLFFALSGYWITRMWSDKYQYAPNAYVVFVFSRFARLLPVFFIINIVNITVLIFLNMTEKFADILNFHGFISNLFIIGFSSLPFQPLVPAWSLDIEIQFYLLAPLLLRVVYPRPTFVLLFSFMVTVLSNEFVGDWAVTSFAVFFAVGAWIAVKNWEPSSLSVMISLVITLVLFVVCLTVPGLEGVLLGGANPAPEFAFNKFFNEVVAVVMVPCAFFTVYQQSPRSDKMFSDLSYIVYLAHWPAVVLLGVWFGSLPPLARLPYVIGTIVGVLLFSFFLWLCVDRPANVWRTRMVAKWLKSPGYQASPSIGRA
jgi:peptidoglycan/LPS O-acetylase OafA/YrhL